MDIQPLAADQGPWKVMGALKYLHATSPGQFTIRVSPGSLKVELGGAVYVLPVELVVALQSEETKRFLSDPTVAPFLYGTGDRDSRVNGARKLALLELGQKRRDLVAHLMTDHGLTEREAWNVARIKYPDLITEEA